MIIQVASDLSSSSIVYTPAAGSWGGVLCDLYDPRWIWGFGDFGAGVKAVVTTDYGVSWTDIGDDSWLNDELVRPLLVSSIDPNDIVAVLNDDVSANETWHSSDTAVTWTKVGDTNFYAQSAIRDFYNDPWIWIGRNGAGANHLQFSPNMGDDWMERSSGVTANAPISVIIVSG